MANAAAMAAGVSFRRHDSLEYIHERNRADADILNELGQHGQPLHRGPHHHHKIDPKVAKSLLPEFYDPKCETASLRNFKNNNNKDDNRAEQQHPKLSLQASSSSINSTNRPLMVIVDNAIVGSPELSSQTDSYYPNYQTTVDGSGKKSKRKCQGHRRQSSWKEPGTLTRAIPYLSPQCIAKFCCFVNVFLPGFGTLIAAIVAGCRADSARSEFSPRRAFLWNLLAATIQLVFAPVIFGWIYAIVWGLEAMKRAKLLDLAKQVPPDDNASDRDDEADAYDPDYHQACHSHYHLQRSSFTMDAQTLELPINNGGDLPPPVPTTDLPSESFADYDETVKYPPPVQHQQQAQQLQQDEQFLQMHQLQHQRQGSPNPAIIITTPSLRQHLQQSEDEDTAALAREEEDVFSDQETPPPPPTPPVILDEEHQIEIQTKNKAHEDRNGTHQHQSIDDEQQQQEDDNFV